MTKLPAMSGVEAGKSQDDIVRDLLGPSGVPGAPDPAKMTPQCLKKTRSTSIPAAWHNGTRRSSLVRRAPCLEPPEGALAVRHLGCEVDVGRRTHALRKNRGRTVNGVSAGLGRSQTGDQAVLCQASLRY